jgi:hypothetical protein
MKARIYAGIVVLSALGSGVALLAMSRTARHSEKEWNGLSAKVEQLEQTTSQLQVELDAARKSLSAFAAHQPMETINLPAIKNLIVPRTEAPPGSTPFVFNGVTYYVTPLAQAR